MLPSTQPRSKTVMLNTSLDWWSHLLLVRATKPAKNKRLYPKPATYTKKVERLLYALQTPKLPSLSEVARQLHCSTRALQRFLQAEGSSFKQITTTVQQQMALAYLKQDLSIQETASLLNYASSSAFVHAFKRWFGQSPQQYRSVHFKM